MLLVSVAIRRTKDLDCNDAINLLELQDYVASLLSEILSVSGARMLVLAMVRATTSAYIGWSGKGSD
jgi:hexokinase